MDCAGDQVFSTSDAFSQAIHNAIVHGYIKHFKNVNWLGPLLQLFWVWLPDQFLVRLTTHLFQLFWRYYGQGGRLRDGNIFLIPWTHSLIRYVEAFYIQQHC